MLLLVWDYWDLLGLDCYGLLVRVVWKLKVSDLLLFNILVGNWERGLFNFLFNVGYCLFNVYGLGERERAVLYFLIVPLM